jgi:MFS transporter, FSR family, fosmidomycin resistance protein
LRDETQAGDWAGLSNPSGIHWSTRLGLSHMQPTQFEVLPATGPTRPERTLYGVLLAVSCSHLLNDTIQSLIPSLYPSVKEIFHLSFTQVGLITFTFQLTASLMQPLVGFYTDRRPMPFSLVMGMGFTLLGLVLLSLAWSFPLLLLAVGLVGLGSAVFHPEASRLAHLASGGRRGLAQSLFQVGGNAGASLGPLLAAAIIAHGGQSRVLWFCLVALVGIFMLWRLGRWYREHALERQQNHQRQGREHAVSLSGPRVVFSLAILMVLLFSKYFYLASLTSYYTFYLIAKFHLSIQSAQVHLFIFLFSVATGALIGGPVGDRVGRKHVIWVSILGVAPFTLLLPHAGLLGTGILSVFIGLILSSAFSAILVYAQELVPGRVGMVSGLFFGLAFGLGGIGSAVLGHLADHTSIQFVFRVCSFLPLLGICAGLLPDLNGRRSAQGETRHAQPGQQ